METLSAVT